MNSYFWPRPSSKDDNVTDRPFLSVLYRYDGNGDNEAILLSPTGRIVRVKSYPS